MKRYTALFFAFAVVLSGCSNVVTKSFKVFADPHDASIRVVSGIDLKEVRYRSPAGIVVEVPKDPALAAKAILEVRKDKYKPMVMALSDIKDGDVLNVKLERLMQDIVKYRLKYRLISPAVSPELQFRDRVVSVSFSVAEQSFQVNFKNTSMHDVRILWERAEYTDVNRQPHRLMPAGIVRYQDRNNPLPDQIVLANTSAQLTLVPVHNVFMNQQKKSYETRPLFQLEGDAAAGLKGKSVNLFIPVEIDRQIIPYNFKIEIADAVREIAKE